MSRNLVLPFFPIPPQEYNQEYMDSNSKPRRGPSYGFNSYKLANRRSGVRAGNII